MKKLSVTLLILFVFLTFVSCGPKAITENEIHIAYQKAFEFYITLDADSLPLDPDAERVEDYYWKVKHDTIKTYDDLRNYLYDIFSKELADQIMTSLGERYKDINGELYVMAGARGTDIFKGAETYEIIKQNSKKYTYRVTVEVFGDDLETVVDHEVHDMTYEYIGEKWVWTKFNLFV